MTIHICIIKYFVVYCVNLTCSNVIVGILAIMVRPEWVNRLIEFLYILVSKNAKNGVHIK